MACERYRDALSDVAAGAPASAGIEAHLAACEACRDELAALRQALSITDDEMARLLLAEPPPELAARIRTAVAESAPAEPTGRLGWRFMLTAAAAAVVAAIVLVAQRAPRPQPPAHVTDRRAAHETPRATAVPALGVAGFPSVGARQAPPGPRSAYTQQPVREPEVLVPAGEAEALLRLAANLQRRRVTPDSLLVADLSAPLAEPTLGEIRPIEIVPLDPAESSGVE